jgi:hypothetical protein
VAGRTRDLERVRECQQICRDCGGEITFDWTGPDGEIQRDWSLKRERAREISTRERDAVYDCDVLVALHYDEFGLGQSIEIGMAMAFEKRVIVIGPFRESVFWYLPKVVRIDSMDQLSDQLVPVSA